MGSRPASRKRPRTRLISPSTASSLTPSKAESGHTAATISSRLTKAPGRDSSSLSSASWAAERGGESSWPSSQTSALSASIQAERFQQDEIEG